MDVLAVAAEWWAVGAADGGRTTDEKRTHGGQAHGRTVAADVRWLASGCVAVGGRLRMG